MSVTAPPAVTRYLAASDAGDPAAIAECFTSDATVLDEGAVHRGRAEIRAWREGVAAKYTFTSTVTCSEPLDEDHHRVAVRIEGDFPGGVADLTYRFGLRDGLVADLAIVG
jgi:ketosteroid isomerase-like protein